MLYLWVFLCCIFYFMGFFAASGNVVMITKNVTLSFDDVEALFGELFILFLYFFPLFSFHFL